MAYIPPHKRLSKDSGRPSPTPEKLCKDIDKDSCSKDIVNAYQPKIINHDTRKWFVVNGNGNNQFPSTVQLQPIPLESVGRETGEKPFVLVNSHVAKDDVCMNKSNSPWDYIAETAWPHILSSFERVRKKMEESQVLGDVKKMEESQVSGDVKGSLVARFGKILFNWCPSVDIESLRTQLTEESLQQFKTRTFYTHVPTSYKEKVIHEIVPKIGLDFVEDKDTYRIILYDNILEKRLFCKCTLNEDKKLELYKVEFRTTRYMLVDVSCIDKNADLRLGLVKRRLLTAINDEIMQGIRTLIDSAIVDPGVKAGLRWPFGKERYGDRLRVSWVWHTVAKIYDCPSVRLRVKQVDRFHFKSSHWESTREIVLKLKTILPLLQERKVEDDTAYNMFKDNIKLIWNHILGFEPFFT